METYVDPTVPQKDSIVRACDFKVTVDTLRITYIVLSKEEKGA